MRRRTSILAALFCQIVGAGEVASEVIAPAAYYPEGLFWDANTGWLFYTEMTRDRVVRLAENREQSFVVERGCGPTAIGRAGEHMVIACHLGGYLLVTDSAGVPEQRIWVDEEGAWLRDPNAIASRGDAVYISDSGVFSTTAAATGAVLYWQPGKPLRRLAEGLRYANGLAVDQRFQRLLVSEHLAQRILEFPIENDGGLGSPATFADLSEFGPLLGDYALAGPDGLALGPDDRVYAAVYGTGRVLVFDSAGALVGSYTRPERYVTTVAVVDGQVFIGGAFDNSVFPYLGQVARVPLASIKPAQR